MTTALRVLYVDDEQDLLYISKLFLQESGDITVTTALSGTEGIRLLEQKKFDAIISDYQMPGMDGIQFLIEVRTRFGPIPFILFTGRGREEIVIQAINSGADFYLQKGGEPGAQFAELSHKVKSAALRKRADDSLQESEIRHRTILQTTKDGFWIIELPGGQLTDVNETYCRMSGYTRAELLTMHIPDLDAVRTPEEQAATLQSIITNGSGIFETRHHRKDGSVFDVELSVTYQNTNGGELICFCRDITGRKRAEQELVSAQLRLNEAHRLAHIGTWVWVIETDTVTWSEELCNIAGWNPSLPAPTYAELPRCYTASSWALLSNAVMIALTTGEPYNLELEMIRPDGSIRWTNAFGGVNCDGDKKVIGLHGTVQDITDHKRAEEARLKNTEELHAAYEQLTASEEELRQNVDDLSRSEQELRKSEEKFHSLYKHMIEGAALHELTFNDQGIPEDYVIIEINPAFEKQLGISREVVLGKTSKEAYGVTEPPFLKIYAQVAMSGEPEVFETYFPPLAKHFSISVYCPYKGSFATIFEDITGRKIAENALRTSEEKYRKAFLTSPDSICITRMSDGMIVSANKGFADMTGYSEEEVVGKTSLEINLWKDPNDRRKIVEGLKARGEVRDYEAHFLTKNGEIYGSMSASVIELDGVPHILNITRDISGRKTAEEKKQETGKGAGIEMPVPEENHSQQSPGCPS